MISAMAFDANSIDNLDALSGLMHQGYLYDAAKEPGRSSSERSIESTLVARCECEMPCPKLEQPGSPGRLLPCFNSFID